MQHVTCPQTAIWRRGQPFLVFVCFEVIIRCLYDHCNIWTWRRELFVDGCAGVMDSLTSCQYTTTPDSASSAYNSIAANSLTHFNRVVYFSEVLFHLWRVQVHCFVYEYTLHFEFDEMFILRPFCVCLDILKNVFDVPLAVRRAHVSNDLHIGVCIEQRYLANIIFVRPPRCHTRAAIRVDDDQETKIWKSRNAMVISLVMQI
jgi:hypothetical protein